MFKKIITGLCLAVLITPVFSGAVQGKSKAVKNKTIILATTTSVQDTGLLDVLISAFQKKSGYIVKAIAVGSGQAMQMGKSGEADLLWVHSPDDEKGFVAGGYGTDRTTFMYNDFVLLGPASDPAKIKGEKKVAGAFAKIVSAGALFVSRGDKSGTHKKELKLWAAAKVKPVGEKYIESGQGMAATVAIANEKEAYILADRSSFLSLQKNINLQIVCENDEALLNRYSLILANPVKFPKVNVEGAKAFFDFLLTKKTKKIVGKYGVEKYGKPLFHYDYPAK
ncbi:MAG: tungsten ABC transporter substrate-binding protein [Elusimicrobia bacterium CG_4_10_14_0_2_um_filter_56_8]|nr:MAG: tungsten ABC transporter substrate-binding protein [Elusimicrobia bacterium CG1_02_56_21]PJA16049.1 MAG: tungsten ABC transporter substrate-binding protein [Elusimicrobia bacterium CG_4_10_14_0_2_um_filter_56_8]